MQRHYVPHMLTRHLVHVAGYDWPMLCLMVSVSWSCKGRLGSPGWGLVVVGGNVEVV